MATAIQRVRAHTVAIKVDDYVKARIAYGASAYHALNECTVRELKLLHTLHNRMPHYNARKRDLVLDLSIVYMK